jgi:CRISPR/Cas system-associated endonuclease Cas1
MIELRYSNATPQVEDWEDDLKRLALAHKLVQIEQLETPVLVHSGAEYAGREAITAYLRKLDEESEQWWYCVCDRN